MISHTRLLFTDIDGTLLRADQTVPDRVSEMLSQMAREGHGLILASGRPLGSMLGVYERLSAGLSAPFSKALCIANNGAQIYDIVKGQTIYEKRLPLSLVDSLQDLADSMGVHLQTYTDTHLICSADDAETRSYRKRVILPVLLSPRLSEALDKPPFKMLALSLQGSEFLMPFRKEAMKRCGERMHTVFSGDGYLEIIEKSVDKGNALRIVAEHYQIPISETFAVGDSENDLTLIKAAATGYAMQNALQRVKDAAPRITLKDNEEGGICEVIGQLLAEKDPPA